MANFTGSLYNFRVNETTVGGSIYALFTFDPLPGNVTGIQLEYRIAGAVGWNTSGVQPVAASPLSMTILYNANYEYRVVLQLSNVTFTVVTFTRDVAAAVLFNYTKFPLLSPFKWYKNGVSNIHFDGDFFVSNIKSFDKKLCYYQKWQRGDSTIQQITSTIAPNPLQYYSGGIVVKTTAWVNKGTVSLGVSVWEVTIDFSTLPDGYYNLFAKGQLAGSINKFEYVSEAIYLKDVHPNTMLFNAYNSYNDFDIIFTTNYSITFRCEAGIMDYSPERERVSFTDEINDIKTLFAVPFRKYKLNIGEAAGVAPWVIDTLNRIFCCNHWEVEALQYETQEGTKWEISRQKNYSGIGGSIDIMEAKNLFSNEINSGFTSPGIVTAYNIETNFFGAPNFNNQVRIIQNQIT